MVVLYEIKTFLKADQENAHVFMQELESLLRLQHLKGVMKLMDVIEDDESISLLLLPKGSVTLREILDEQRRSGASQILFARHTMKALVEIVDKVHQKGVMHRNLNLDCVMMDYCFDQAPKVFSITDFDTAYHLKSRRMIKQSFTIEGKMLPPEVEAGEA